MKALIIAITLLTILISCEKPQKPSFICQAAKLATDTLALQISNRWDCNFDKVSTFIYKPIEEKFCSKEKSAIATTACNLIINSLVNMGTVKIAIEFSCNADKVKADLENADKLCEMLTK